ncbi:hypothetical protein BDR22DRAFT_842133 [Usnea florida]
MPTTYTGPSVREMLANHTTASEIIARAHDPHPIFDDKDLAILRRFCKDPSCKGDILKELDIVDQPGDKVGEKAQRRGTLAGFIVAKSAAGEDLLGEDEMEALRKWFQGGAE